jgi:hypothetical protein
MLLLIYPLSVSISLMNTFPPWNLLDEDGEEKTFDD